MKKKKETQNNKGMTRREFIRTTGAATGAALVAASVGPFVHTTMAKGGTLKVCSYGGSYQESQRKALIQPFAEKFGVNGQEPTATRSQSLLSTLAVMPPPEKDTSPPSL